MRRVSTVFRAHIGNNVVDTPANEVSLLVDNDARKAVLVSCNVVTITARHNILFLRVYPAGLDSNYNITSQTRIISPLPRGFRFALDMPLFEYCFRLHRYTVDKYPTWWPSKPHHVISPKCRECVLYLLLEIVTWSRRGTRCFVKCLCVMRNYVTSCSHCKT